MGEVAENGGDSHQMSVISFQATCTRLIRLGLVIEPDARDKTSEHSLDLLDLGLKLEIRRALYDAKLGGEDEMVFELECRRDGDLEESRELAPTSMTATFGDIRRNGCSRAAKLWNEAGKISAAHALGRAVDVQGERMRLLPDFQPSEVLHDASVKATPWALAVRRQQPRSRSGLHFAARHAS